MDVLTDGMNEMSDLSGILPGHPANLTVDGDGVPAVAGGGDVIEGHTRLDRGDDAVIRAITHADIDAAASNGHRRAQRLWFLRLDGRISPCLLYTSRCV